MSWQINVRKKSMKWTDARSRMLQELLASFSIIKYFTSENAYLERIRKTRDTELVGVWKISLIKAGNQGEIGKTVSPSMWNSKTLLVSPRIEFAYAGSGSRVLDVHRCR
jgi:hypothetical protein